MSLRLHIEGQPLTKKHVSHIFGRYGIVKVYETFHEDGHDFTIKYGNSEIAKVAYDKLDRFTGEDNNYLLELSWIDINNVNNNIPVNNNNIPVNNNKDTYLLLTVFGDSVLYSQVVKLFVKYGKVTVCQVEDKVFRIEYRDGRDALDAYNALNRHEYTKHGCSSQFQLLCPYFDNNNNVNNNNNTSCDVFVFNNSCHYLQAIKKLQQYGKVVDTHMVMKVTFQNPGDAENARKALNNNKQNIDIFHMEG